MQVTVETVTEYVDALDRRLAFMLKERVDILSTGQNYRAVLVACREVCGHVVGLLKAAVANEDCEMLARVHVLAERLDEVNAKMHQMDATLNKWMRQHAAVNMN